MKRKMTDRSNNNGRGYEYIFLLTLEEEISKTRKVIIKHNTSYYASKRAWESLDKDTQNCLKISSKSAIIRLFDLEPLILENDNDTLSLYIQQDVKGEKGDVRDIIIIRSSINWEIGLSIKHNHFAVKHSRLSAKLDFGEEWFNDECSNEYWKEIKPIFEYLKNEKEKQTKWSDLPNKEQDVYVPLLKAFMNEIKRSYEKDKNLPQKMAEYLLGKYDFYKVISVDKEHITKIQPYNIRGNLNKSSKTIKPKIIIPISSLPTNIKLLDFKDNSNNTLEMYLNNYWTFSFRIHNASTIVEPSLKFDIQICGMPTTIITINCIW